MMEPNTLTIIQTLKKDLQRAIEEHDYNLLNEEVLNISVTLDNYLNSSFLNQIKRGSN